MRFGEFLNSMSPEAVAARSSLEDALRTEGPALLQAARQVQAAAERGDGLGIVLLYGLTDDEQRAAAAVFELLADREPAMLVGLHRAGEAALQDGASLTEVLDLVAQLGSQAFHDLDDPDRGPTVPEILSRGDDLAAFVADRLDELREAERALATEDELRDLSRGVSPRAAQRAGLGRLDSLDRFLALWRDAEPRRATRDDAMYRPLENARDRARRGRDQALKKNPEALPE